MNPAPATDCIDAFADALWLESGLSANTLAAYRRDLALFAQWLHPQAVDLLSVQEAHSARAWAVLRQWQMRRRRRRRRRLMVFRDRADI